MKGEGTPLKSEVPWLEALIFDPLSLPVARLLAHVRWVSPTQVTVVSMLFRGAAFFAFAEGAPAFGAGFFFLGYVADCVDGKLARLTMRTSPRGAALDATSDVAMNSALLVVVGLSFDATLWLTLWCASTYVGSTSMTLLTGVEQSRSNVKAASSWATTTRRMRMLPYPGVVELLVLCICVTPLLGEAAVQASLALGAIYFTVAWILKLIGMGRDSE